MASRFLIINPIYFTRSVVEICTQMRKRQLKQFYSSWRRHTYNVSDDEHKSTIDVRACILTSHTSVHTFGGIYFYTQFKFSSFCSIISVLDAHISMREWETQIRNHNQHSDELNGAQVFDVSSVCDVRVRVCPHNSQISKFIRIYMHGMRTAVRCPQQWRPKKKNAKLTSNKFVVAPFVDDLDDV